MSDFNFKVGQSVYYPTKSNQVLVIHNSGGSNYPLQVTYTDPIYNNVSHTTFTVDGLPTLNDVNSPIFPATQEWYERLSHVYPNLEKPSIKKSSKEIIQALLDGGNAGVLCWVSDSTRKPNSNNFTAIITGIGNTYIEHDETSWVYATPIISIKSINQVITDYVDSKVITEIKDEHL